MNGSLILARHLRMCHKEYLIYLKGGSGSGGWGHDGRQGKHGGSQAGSGGLKKIGVTPRAGIARRKKLAKKVSTTKRIARTLKPGKKPTSKVKPTPKKTVPAKKVSIKKPKVEPVEEKKTPIKSKGADVRAELVGMTEGFTKHAGRINKKQEALNTSLIDLYQRDETLTEKVEQGKISSEKADAERQSIQNGFAKAQNDVDSIEEMKATTPRSANIKSQRELLYAKEGPATIKINMASNISQERATEFQVGIDEFSKMLGKGTVMDSKTVRVMEEGERAFHSGGNITMDTSSGKSVVVHELAHALELHSQSSTVEDAQVHRKAISFLNHRTKGETAQSLRELTGNSGYNSREVAKPDKFAEPYMGRIYSHKSSEIISMGMEEMWKNPAKFAKDDPEYFDFIYDTLEGARTHN